MPPSNGSQGRGSETDRRDQRKVARTADAIGALLRVYKSDTVVFFKTLDNILVALGEPFGLHIIDLDDPSVTFDTLASEDVAASGREVCFGGVIGLVVTRPNRSGEDQVAQREAVARGTAFAAALATALSSAEQDGEIASLGQRLRAGLTSAVRGSPRVAESPSGGVTERAAAEQLSAFFERIELFLRGQNYELEIDHGEEGGIPRILFFHRYVAESGSEPLRLQLLSSQRELLKRHVLTTYIDGTGIHPDELDKEIGRAFTSGCWMVENSFRTGVTSWIDWPWNSAAPEEVAASVRYAQSAVSTLGVGSRLGESDVDGSGVAPFALVIPIHVDGRPWLAAAAIVRSHDPSELRWAQYFYRDLLPYLTTTIRGAAERAFLQEITKLTSRALFDGRAEPEEITERLAPLACAFPYGKVTLSRTGQRNRIGWRNADAFVVLGSQGVDAGRVAYTRLDPNGVVHAIDGAQNAFKQERMQELEERLSSHVDIGHTLKNVVSCTGWAAAVREVAIVHRNFDTLEKQGFTRANVSRIRTALSFADRSLSLFWNVEGLGHFIRLAGAQAGKFDWSKFRSAIEPGADAAERIDHRVVTAYADSVALVAKGICFGWAWPVLSIESSVKTQPEIWQGEPSPIFAIQDIHFPPFQKGKEEGFSIIFCLLEPMVNAVRALNGFFPADSAIREDPTSLQISISDDPNDCGAVVVSVVNLSRKPLVEKLSGLESTKHMMKDMGIGSFATPKVEPLDSGLFRITIQVRFHPQSIAKTILNPKGDLDARTSS